MSTPLPFHALLDICKYAFRGGRIPVVYFDKIKNVGDMLNPYMLPRIAGRELVRMRTSRMPHLRAIGSLMGSASKMSYIWGSGSIDGAPFRHELSAQKVFAVRGPGTLRLVESHVGRKFNIPLGDPAVLMEKYFKPDEVHPAVKLGVIPHFTDLDSPIVSALCREDNVRVIDVRLPVEHFINALVGCAAVISSSLHGCILADTYSVPNCWVEFGRSIHINSFKFMDYYATTDAGVPAPIQLEKDMISAEIMRKATMHARVNTFRHDRALLLEAFPKRELEALSFFQ